MASLFSDLHLTLRNLRRRPAFSLAVIVVLALGLGASSTVFSLVHDVLLRPLPYPQPHEMVYLGWQEGEEDQLTTISPVDFLDVRAASDSFEALAAMAVESFALAGDQGAERIAAARVTPGFFQVMGLPMVAGRVPAAAEEGLLVISEGLAARRFGGADDALGQLLELGGESWTVVGVAPQALDVPEGSKLWLTSTLPSGVNRGARYLHALGRLEEGVPLDQAEQELVLLSKRLAREYPDTNRNTRAFLVGLQDDLTREVRPALLALLVAVGFVLLIVTANAAALLLARSVARARELGVRVALGASRLRLVQQIVTESLVLALLGALAGFLLALWAGRSLVGLFPLDLPRVEDFALGPFPLVVHFALALLVGVVCGLLPALHVVRRGSVGTAGLGAGRRSESRSTLRLQGLVLVPQIAVTLVLLIGAGLMLTSLVKLLRVDPGFDTGDRLVARVILPRDAYPERQQQAAFFHDLLRELEARPGITAAAGVTNLPLTGSNMLFPIEPAQGAKEGQPRMANYRAATPGYFRTLGVPVRGREIAAGDRAGATPVALVNETLARQLFPGVDPIGRRLVIGFGEPVERRVVGVVGDVRHFGLEAEPKPEVFVPLSQNPWPFLNLVLETRGEAALLAPSVRSAVASLDPSLPVEDLRPMDRLVGTQTARPRFYAVLLGSFGLLALLVAVVGIYGSTAYGVRLRRVEIGVRMALGATRREVFALFVRRPLRLALVGTAVGMVAAFLLARGLSSMLYDLSPLDPWFYAGAALVLVLAAALAGGLPARQAARTDPVRSLQAE